MYSRKENTMANKHDSFDFDKFKSKEKKKKPIKEKKEKDSSFDMGGGFNFKSRSDSFNTDKFKAKEKKEKPFKEIKDKDSSFDMDGGFKFSSLFKKKENDVSMDSEIGGDGKKNTTMINRIIILAACAIVLVTLIGVGIGAVVDYSNQISEDGNNISDIFISSMPQNTTYYIGDERADYSGLKLGITLKNGNTYYVEYSEENASEFIFRGFDSSAYNEEQTITVTYKGYDRVFKISILERPQATPILSKISLETLPKTEYKVGEWLDTTGGVILLEYKNHASLRVNLMNKDVYGWEEAYEGGPGTYTLTVIYVENGVLAQTTYTITVTE